MDIAALTMLVFGMVIVGSGLTGLFAPQLLLTVLGITEIGSTTQLFLMATSQASLAMGLYYILASVNGTRVFFQWSVPLRIINFIVFAAMIPLGIAPMQWLLVAGLELAGASATAIALASKSHYTLDHFHVLRIASLTLALIGGILAFKPFGIYGSASAFLLISSVGMLYAYRRFNPVQTGEQ
ncbi:MAG: hypothetical protein KF758_10620 [Anaerolineales bacterium]|jgi:hypothetical protein|nr:hypothetical protein [Anaerolineales bacterium]